VGEVVPADELDEELSLAPPSGLSANERLAMLETAATDDELDDEDENLPDPSQQFTLRDMMLLTFIAAVGFAILRLFPPPVFAAAAGGFAILGLAALSVLKPQKLIFHLMWWTVLAVYIIASIIAVLTK
jgi:hypothetical protein